MTDNPSPPRTLDQLSPAERRALLDQLLAMPVLDGVRDSEGLNRLGLLIDLGEMGDSVEASDLALAWAAELDRRVLSESDRTLFHYFWANAWGVRQHRLNRDIDAAWAWDQTETAQQILQLRTALNSPDSSDWIGRAGARS